MTGRLFGLDVLRAVAILSVLWLHAWDRDPLTFHLGFLVPDGVSVFFVLSGYLVGGILLRDVASGRGVWSFLVRRWWRTLPAYIFIVLLMAALERPAVDLARYLTFTQNLTRWSFDFYHESWSLSVEEWFYLVAGALVAWFRSWAVRPRSAVASAAVVLIACTWAYRWQVGPLAFPQWLDAVRFTVLGDLDSIGIGMLAAVVLNRWPELGRRHARAWALLGVMIVYSLRGWLQRDTGPLVLALLMPASAVGVVLCLPFLVRLKRFPAKAGGLVEWISDHAYCLYLVNLSLVALYLMPRMGLVLGGDLVAAGVFFGLSVVAAVLLRRCVEQPYLTWRDGGMLTGLVRA